MVQRQSMPAMRRAHSRSYSCRAADSAKDPPLERIPRTRGRLGARQSDASDTARIIRQRLARLADASRTRLGDHYVRATEPGRSQVTDPGSNAISPAILRSGHPEKGRPQQGKSDKTARATKKMEIPKNPCPALPPGGDAVNIDERNPLTLSPIGNWPFSLI